MKLMAGERMILSRILPAQADFTTLRIVRELENELSFSEVEHRDLQLVVEKLENNQERTTWDTKADKGKEIELGPKARGLIVTAFEGLGETKHATMQQFDLYERFMEEDKKSEEVSHAES